MFGFLREQIFKNMIMKQKFNNNLIYQRNSMAEDFIHLKLLDIIMKIIIKL